MEVTTVVTDPASATPQDPRPIPPSLLRGVTARLRPSGGAAGRLAPRLRQEWVLTFPARWRGRADPLTGWWGQGDPLATMTLRFPTRQAAENYARREGLVLDAVDAPGTLGAPRGMPAAPAEAAEPTLPWTWGGRAPATEAEPGPPSADQRELEEALVDPAGVFADPMDVVRHPRLTRWEKLEILKRWEWDARLIEAAQAEGMPDAGEPSRLEDVLAAHRALLAEARSNAGAPRPGRAPRSPARSVERHRIGEERRLEA